jgi:hypothetical protein
MALQAHFGRVADAIGMRRKQKQKQKQVRVSQPTGVCALLSPVDAPGDSHPT